MKDPNPDQQTPLFQSPQDTPPQAIEQEGVLPVAEEAVKPPKKRSKKPASSKLPPKAMVPLLTEEERRSLERINREVIKKLGIKKNNSYVV